MAALAARVSQLLVWTALLFGLAAVAEIGRYLMLLRNRTRLIEPALLAFSDAAVLVTSITGLIFAFLTAVGCVGWLADARATVFGRAGRLDPRPRWMLLAGCLIPGLNLVYPGVFLTELVRDRQPRLQRAVRVWWLAWLVGAGLTAAAFAYRTADSLQGQADGVMMAAWADAGAAVVAVVTLWLIRLFGGRDLFGHERAAQRWLVAAGPSEPRIAPIRAASPPVVRDTAADEAAAAGAGSVEVQEVPAK
ncbi:DUF4328 domain-containing protein [Skermania piniformis]|uniref:DUF4328 domain-containing protein n=1 Tax=Skermania pinensis TaxID=39122 RepID=A0ABX8S831_9ACTN|nr:DUF4328 domain-containing protein [Skermania piniformis]QXQ14003.1 DUF4328 domain-containing protein [Skermania piniformis]